MYRISGFDDPRSDLLEFRLKPHSTFPVFGISSLSRIAIALQPESENCPVISFIGRVVKSRLSDTIVGTGYLLENQYLFSEFTLLLGLEMRA